MAFVSKAERKLVLYQNCNNLGPGSYLGINSYKKKKVKVPFCTTTEKLVFKPEGLITPGPGSYIEPLPKQRPTYNLIQSSAFASQIERFPSKPSPNPGPGSYDTSSGWRSSKPLPKQDITINWIRQPSAPSIPRQGYCYSDDEDGELVMKRVSEKDEKCVGPGSYEPKISTKSRLFIWGRPDTSRNIIGLKSISPGPGAYNSKSPEPRYKVKETASFMSKSKRDGYLPDFINEKDVPGPGRYATNTCFLNTSQSNRIQNFGSRCERFRSNTPDQLPGPGSYTYEDNLKSANDKKVPFDSSRPRFLDTLDERPGPGSYYKGGDKKVPGTRSGFGANQERFIYSREYDLNPGPGSYELNRMIKNPNRIKGSSVFVSKSKRIPVGKSDNSTPPPGSYEVTKTIGEIKQIGSVVHPVLVREGSTKRKAFNIQSDRFDENTRSFTPGPGAYSQSEKRNFKGFIIEKNPRFKENLSESPGPGSYSDISGWNKKSFNAIFDLNK